MKTSASATLNAVWKSAAMRERIGLESRRVRGDRMQKRQHQRAADQAIEQIAQRQAAAGRIVALAAFDQRIDRAAEIGAKDQGERRHRA